MPWCPCPFKNEAYSPAVGKLAKTFLPQYSDRSLYSQTIQTLTVCCSLKCRERHERLSGRMWYLYVLIVSSNKFLFHSKTCHTNPQAEFSGGSHSLTKNIWNWYSGALK